MRDGGGARFAAECRNPADGDGSRSRDSPGDVRRRKRPGADNTIAVRVYSTAAGTYVGVAYKGYGPQKIMVKLPAASGTVTNLVTGKKVNARVDNGQLVFDLDAGPMELDAYLIK